MRPVVGIVSPWDIGNDRAWSGAIHPMVEEMRRHTEVVDLGRASSTPTIVDRGFAKLSGKLGRGYLVNHAVLTSYVNSKVIERVVSSLQLDAVVSIAGSTYTLKIPKDLPVVQITDATFSSLVDFYPSLSNLNWLSEKQGLIVDRLNARRSDHFMAASQWAASSIHSELSVPRRKITVAPFGPGPAAKYRNRYLRETSTQEALRILFVSTNWIRKSGPEVLELFSRYRSSSPSSQLIVVGEAPGAPLEGVEYLGRLNPDEIARQYARADVLIEATHANAAGMTLTDSAAYGLPVIARNVGGIETIVIDGETGFLVAPSKDFIFESLKLLKLLQDKKLRQEMSLKSHRHYEKNLSWSAWGQKYKETIGGLLNYGS